MAVKGWDRKTTQGFINILHSKEFKEAFIKNREKEIQKERKTNGKIAREIKD